MKTTSPLFLVVILIVCLGPLQNAQAVSPPPDGGYAGGNTAEGQNALFSRTTGGYNTAVGYLSLVSDMTGSFNTAIGAGTLLADIGSSNTAIGAGALLSNVNGFENTATGAFALPYNTSNFNTADGFQALVNNTTGIENTAVGHSALYGNMTGMQNTAIGFGAGFNVATASNVICIGAIHGKDVSNTCFIDQIRGVTTQNNDAIPVVIDSDGQLGTFSSSRRFKKDIKPMDKASESLLALKPVSFRYKMHKDSSPQFGLVAEEVAQVNPDLVIYDTDGKPFTVRYDAVNAMLLNEFLKEHHKVQEQGARLTKQEGLIAQQQKQIETLTAGLQKVSAQLAAASPSFADLK